MCISVFQEGYYGPTKGALGFFESLGLVCEKHFNPADFFCKCTILRVNLSLA